MFNKKIKTYLDRLAESSRRPSSYLFLGAGEIEKEEAAFYFILKLAKKVSDEEFLLKIRAKNHPDVVIIEPEIEEKKGKIREKEISVSQVREALERIKFFPYELEKKYCIIKKTQKMNAEAANGLLKSLEEPSESAIFILLASDIDSILPTIVSRCAILRFPVLGLQKWNEENRDTLKNIFKNEIFENFDCIEKISKNRGEFILTLREWELVIAQSMRKLVAKKEDKRKIEKVVELLENTREAINRLERTNANARGIGEELVLKMS